MEPRETRLYGRRAFLGVTAVGLSSLVWGTLGLAGGLRGRAPVRRRAALRDHSVRLADLHGRRDDAAVRPGNVAPSDRRSRRPAADDRLRAAACAACGRAGLDVPLRDGLDGQQRPLARGAFRRPARAPPAHIRTPSVLTFTSAEQPYVDTLTLDQAHLPDVMLAYEMDGKPLPRQHGAPVRVVIPDMYGYKGVKWVERITVGVRGEAGLLGAARLRHRRLGGPLEWPLSRSTSSGSRGRSGRCTGCTRRRSSGCSPRVSCSMCRGSASWSAGGRC